jgi:hypothetical protein
MSLTSSTITYQLIALIPVAAGAVIALGGGAIKYFIDRKERKKERRREKLERLLYLAYELKAWSGRVDDRYVWGTEKERIAFPAEEIMVIATLYFPDLDTEAGKLVECANAYAHECMSIAMEKAKAQGVVPDNVAERLRARYESLIESIDDVTKKARQLSQGME